MKLTVAQIMIVKYPMIELEIIPFILLFKAIDLAEWSVLTVMRDIPVRCLAKLSIMETEWRGAAPAIPGLGTGAR